MRRPELTPIIAMLALAACAACTTGTTGTNEADVADDADVADHTGQPDRITGEIVVFAASSLTEAFTAMAESFRAEHPDAEVVFNFASSSDLVGQIDEGAPADVFAAASDEPMTRLTTAGFTATDPVVIARNTLAIIVAEGNPLGITTLADLATDDLVVIVCAIEAPCGQGAAQVLDKAGVTLTPRSYEQNAKSVVTKVTAGEADAGIVFASDVRAAANAASGVPIPAEVNVINNYPIAVTSSARNSAGARAFIDFVLSAAGRAILTEYGFLTP